MNASAEAAFLIRRAADPRPVDDNVKAAIVRAARRLGLGYERAKSIWYGEARRVDSNEMDRLRALAADRAAKREEAAKDEYRELIRRLSYLEARMDALDEDGSGEMARAAIGPLGVPGRDRRPVDR